VKSGTRRIELDAVANQSFAFRGVAAFRADEAQEMGRCRIRARLFEECPARRFRLRQFPLIQESRDALQARCDFWRKKHRSLYWRIPQVASIRQAKRDRAAVGCCRQSRPLSISRGPRGG
jgi:hypothetical protein